MTTELEAARASQKNKKKYFFKEKRGQQDNNAQIKNVETNPSQPIIIL
jgi:hypothetical protein